jgi:hypothetical protein
MKDTPLTLYVVLLAADNYECLDSIHDSRESSERRKKYLVDDCGFPEGEVEIEPRPICSLSQLSS